MTRLLFAAYLLEAGLLLTISPWTVFWERNYFAQAWPWVGAMMDSPYVRGAVTGVGVVTVIAGLRDLAGSMFTRTPASDSPGQPGSGPQP